jgi:hypothetical protein
MTRDSTRVDLSKIDAKALSKATRESEKLGRNEFLTKWGFRRSSKFYLLHQQRLFDLKALVGASYFHATGRKLPNFRFAGGRQTVTAIKKVMATRAIFRKSHVFEDTLGELSNVADEFDRVSDLSSEIKKLGFSRWVRLEDYEKLNTGGLPGVYVVAANVSQPVQVPPDDRRVLYIGETVNQTLAKRLHQFKRSIDGKGGHSGGDTLRKLRREYRHKRLWLSIRSFPLRADLRTKTARAFRSSQIQLLERLLLYAHVRANGKYPTCNISR